MAREPTSSGSSRSGGIAWTPTAGRTCSVRNRRWPTPCTPQSALASAATTSSLMRCRPVTATRSWLWSRWPSGSPRRLRSPRSSRSSTSSSDEPHALLVGQDEVLDDRVDLALPPPAAEDAVVAHSWLEMMALPVGLEPAAQVVGGEGLAWCTDVVAGSLDGEQRRTGDHPGADDPPTVRQRASGQAVLLEHETDRLQIELSRHVQHGEVLVVEILRRLRLSHMAQGEVVEETQMRTDMTGQVHIHESCQLQEAGIYRPSFARMASRHLGDQILLEPAERLGRRQLVDLGRIDPGVDRAGHQGKALGHGRV